MSETQSECTKELDERLAIALGLIEFVVQTGKVKSERVKYDYATVADLCMAVRGHLAAQGVAVTMDVRDVKQIETKTFKYNKEQISADWLFMVDFTVRHAGQWIRSSIPGFGQGEKGLWAGITQAQKYWLRGTFMIAAGDDAEEDENEPQQRQPEQRQPRQERASQQAKPAVTEAEARHEAVLKACDGAAQILVEMKACPDIKDALAKVKRQTYILAGSDRDAMTTEHVREAMAIVQNEELS